ncbi:MAG: transposase [Candidatus Nanopelagicales bacterium]
MSAPAIANRSVPSPASMSQLMDFRAGLHRCWTGWADAGFELTEAVLCAPAPVSSTPALSLEPCFRRSHGSLYKALHRGGIDAEAIRDLLVTHRPGDTTAAQIRDLAHRLGESQTTVPAPTFCLDAGYDPIALTHELADVRANLVVRIRDDRVFYTDPDPAEPGTLGRPRRHGERRSCADPQSWPAPNHEQTTEDDRYGTVHVSAWHNLHPRLGCRGHWADFQQPPIVSGTVVRVDVQHLPKPTSRSKKTLWLWVAGPTPELDLCWRGYLRRFDIEHTFRFAKNTLGWTTPAVRTPQQADTWTWLIIAAYTQLRLARGLVEDQRLPWERRAKPGRLTPARVRRGFRRLVPALGTPASPPKTQTPGPERPRGSRTGPRTRHPRSRRPPEQPTKA